jgi:hypothetical protein
MIALVAAAKMKYDVVCDLFRDDTFGVLGVSRLGECDSGIREQGMLLSSDQDSF